MSEGIRFAYDIQLVKKLRVLSPKKLTEDQRKELSAKFDEQGYDMQRLIYVGPVDENEEVIA